MPNAVWYFDFVSPYCYLQLKRIEQLRVVLPITPVPILFGAVLAHMGTLGPAEIPGKRMHTYRFVQWQAQRQGVTLRFPPAHPFNPIPALRVVLALGGGWGPIRAIFEHIWRDGLAGDSAAALAEVAARLGGDDVAGAIAQSAVKAQLRSNTEAAIAAGVYGVPTLAIGETLFWGNDATPMIEDFLSNPQLFESDEMQRIASLPVGIERPR